MEYLRPSSWEGGHHCRSLDLARGVLVTLRGRSMEHLHSSVLEPYRAKGDSEPDVDPE